MMKTGVMYNGPAAIRYPRGNGYGVPMDDEIKALEIGKAEIVRDGMDVAIIGIGTQVHYCEQAAEQLAAEGLNPTVVNARFVKPLDKDLILALARSHGSIVTVEDHYVQAGFGSAVMELLEENGLSEVRVMCLGFPDKLIEHASQSTLMAKYGLDADGIYSRVREFVASKYSFERAYHS
jgi:1-deoxy-D-xylulose-5-phosphate synthase